MFQIKIPIKFSDRNIDLIINKVYQNYISSPKDSYYFDLTDVEYITNQELLIFSALLKTFADSNVEFKVEFFRKGISSYEIPERVKKQIIQLWDVWRIWQIAPDKAYAKHFGIDGKSVDSLKRELNYSPKLLEIYERHGVTPFISLNYVNNYSERDVQKIIEPIYKLNAVVQELLINANCSHPFANHSLGTIITEELYLNFLDHSIESSFKGLKQMAFMSISLQDKINELDNTHDKIQQRKELNFKTECLNEARGFHYDATKKEFKNIPYLQFSFLDFGKGISSTLKEQYLKGHPEPASTNLDSEILNFAFNYNSSRHPIFTDADKVERSIPRGLYDVLTVVKRYKGLIIARSNYGKVLFDFSSHSNQTEAKSFFEGTQYYFPGTLISVYIPAFEFSEKIDVSSIKPEIEFSRVKGANKKYINFNSIVDRLKVNKEILYGNLLRELKNQICLGDEHTLVFMSFKDCGADRRLMKKAIFFLLTDYDINHLNNIVLLHPLPHALIDEIKTELLALNDALKKYKLHPLPIVNYDKGTGDMNVIWLGVFDEDDLKKLGDLLYDDYSIAKSDFHSPENLLGHLIQFDPKGNLITNFPNKNDLIQVFENEEKLLVANQIEYLITKHNCIKVDNSKELYLCNGNYYQKEYIDLNNLINNRNDCEIIANLLFTEITKLPIDISKFNFIGVTTSSQKLLVRLELGGFIKKEQSFTLDNYSSLENDLNEKVIDKSKPYILICDLLSTGYLPMKLDKRLKELGTRIELIAVVVSILNQEFSTTKEFLNVFKDKIIKLYERPIKKYLRKEIKSELSEKHVIRVNPYTNIPITLPIRETNYEDSVIFPSNISYNNKGNTISFENEFLNYVDPKELNVGFLKFNNVIHPYFFDTDKIIAKTDSRILKEVFNKINKPNLQTADIKFFYPRKSGIKSLDFNLLRSTLNNHAIEEIEIERFITTEGWRFPHNADYLSLKIDKSICLILDDGSCTGDSLIQMIDEISFYQAKEIILICFIGRVNDHKREFFSRLSKIKVKNQEEIPLSIYFLSHWHIPTYYLDENPNIREAVWLKNIIDIKNTPRSIKKIASTIVKSISPMNRGNDFSDYKYLPKFYGTTEIPKKELLLIREELGKIIGYRLYKESFKFFNYFIRKYEKIKDEKGVYKEIELLCATFAYEPYLYDKITFVVPDVVERIEDFIRILIFKNPNIYTNLTYEWDKKDIMHLFFIVFKNEKLTNELNEDNFVQLVNFISPKEATLDYILYKLLVYFPTSTSGSIKYSLRIKKLLFNVEGNEKLSVAIRSKIKIYLWYISSLPSLNTFDDMVISLKTNYDKIVALENHPDNLFNDKQIINSSLIEIGNKQRKETTYDNEVIVIKNHWEKVALFIQELLSFSSKFPKYFIDERIVHSLESDENSLRKLFGDFTESVYNNEFKIQIDSEKLDQIFLKFILSDSIPYKVFTNPHTRKAEKHLLEFSKKIIQRYPDAKVVLKFTNLDLAFPHHFFELIVRELINNLRHAEAGKEIKIYISILPNKRMKMKIWNYIDPNSPKGGQNGMKILNNINNEYLSATYKRHSRNLKHLQILTMVIL